MNCEKYIGFDVHQATISAAVMDSTGKLIMESILETKASTILEFLGGLRGTLSGHLRGRHLGGLKTRRFGSCVNRFEACSAFTHVTACMLAKSPKVTLYTRGSNGFVSSTAALIASGWSEPSSRAGLSPAIDQRLFTAHV